MLDQIANLIGWIGLGAAGFYVFGKIIITLGDEAKQEKELLQSTWDLQRRIAFRRIWRQSKDPKIIEQIKAQYGLWSLFDIELDDKDYDKKMRLGSESMAYAAALKLIEQEGAPYVLENNEIIFKPSKGKNYHTTPEEAKE